MSLIKKEIIIKGMSCKHCVAHITEQLDKIIGIKVLECEIGRAIITVREDIPDNFIESKIESTSEYKVEKIKDIEKIEKKFLGVFK